MESEERLLAASTAALALEVGKMALIQNMLIAKVTALQADLAELRGEPVDEEAVISARDAFMEAKARLAAMEQRNANRAPAATVAG